MPVARLFVERYKKRHLAAQVRSANGLRSIFKFLEMLGSPSYIKLCAAGRKGRGIITYSIREILFIYNLSIIYNIYYILSKYNII